MATSNSISAPNGLPDSNSTPQTTQDALRRRQLPTMTLSDGSSSSMTGPPPPMPHYLNATGRALRRFAVEGNAIITGGAGTLALISARALLDHGLSNLALFDLPSSLRNPASLSILTSLRVEFPGSIIETYEVDVTDETAVGEAVEQVVRDLGGKEGEEGSEAGGEGGIDILCCFAGLVGCQHADQMSVGEWRRILDVNTTGAFICAQAVAKQMQRLKTGGSIVLISSISAHRTNYPQPQSAYNASKAALLSLKSSLAAEWAVHGIRINSISPGYMDTILNEGEGLEEARRIWTSRNPMGRMGSPEELTGAVVLLCSSWAGRYITGSDLVVDGGQSVF